MKQFNEIKNHKEYLETLEQYGKEKYKLGYSKGQLDLLAKLKKELKKTK